MLEAEGRWCGGEEIGSDSSAERCKVLGWLANLPGLGRLVFSVPSCRKGEALSGSPSKPPGPHPQGETQTHRLAFARGFGGGGGATLTLCLSFSFDHLLTCRPLLSHGNIRLRQTED